MLIYHVSLLCALFSSVHAVAARPSLTCKTSYGSTKKRNIPTVVKTHSDTTTSGIRHTTTVTSTYEPAPLYFTSTKTITLTSSTTIPPYTFTVNSTETLYASSSITETSITTTTSITTLMSSVTKTSTVTEFPPSYFTSLPDQLIEEGFVPVFGDHPRQPTAKQHGRDVVGSYVRDIMALEAIDAYKLRSRAPKKFPSKVVCDKYVLVTKTSTSTVRYTKTSTAERSSIYRTHTTTDTIYKTKTYPYTFTHIVHYETSTLSYTFTSSMTITKRSTSVTTTTSKATSTYYAACSKENIVYGMTTKQQGKWYNESIYYIYNDEGALPAPLTHQPSSYDCCVQCLLNPACEGMAFYEDRENVGAPPSGGAGKCASLTAGDGVCSRSHVPGGVFYQRINAFYITWEVANSYCGKWDFGGERRNPQCFSPDTCPPIHT